MDEIKLKSAYRRCPICKNGDGEVMHTQRFRIDERLHIPAEYDVVCCSRCSFVYADTTASQWDYDRYYTFHSKYEDSKTATGSGVAPEDKARFERYAQFLDSILTNKKASVLDIGCANGGLLKTLREHGFSNLTGVDPSPKCVETVKQLGFDASIGCFSNLHDSVKHLQSPRFDCIALCGVVEHVLDLESALKTVSGVLNENGLLFVDVPDAAKYHEYFIVPFYYFDCEHINHFDEHSLANWAKTSSLLLVEHRKLSIPLTAGKEWGSLIAILQKTKITDPVSFEKNDAVYFSVKKHIEDSMNALLFPKELLALANEQKNIVLWGGGQYAQRALENTPLGKCHISFIVDNDSNKWGREINGVRIHSPEKLTSKQDCTIVVCSALHNAAIVKQIYDMNLSNPIICI